MGRRWVSDADSQPSAASTARAAAGKPTLQRITFQAVVNGYTRPNPMRNYVSLRVVETARRGARHSLPITVSISMPTVQCASLGCRSGARGLMV